MLRRRGQLQHLLPVAERRVVGQQRYRQAARDIECHLSVEARVEVDHQVAILALDELDLESPKEASAAAHADYLRYQFLFELCMFETDADADAPRLVAVS